MDLSGKTKKQLAEEVATLRRRIADLQTLQKRQDRRIPLNEDEGFDSCPEGDPSCVAHIRPQADDRLYQAVFESTGTAMMIVDEKIIIRRVNSEVESVSGYRRDEVEGRALSDFIPADEFKRIMEYHELRKIDPSAPPRRYEFRFINRVGAERYAYITVAHIPETGMTIASFIDITEKKHMEEALRQSEEKHRNLVETMNEGFGSTDENHCLTYANQKFADMLGYTKAEILGRSLKEFIPADYQDAIEDQIARRKNGEAERYEMVWTDKKGNRVMTLVSPMGLFDFHSRFIGTFSTITDITDMKRIEGALRDSEETFRLLAEYAPIGISLMRPDRTFEYFNPPFVEIFGYDIGDLPDKQTWFEKAYPDPLYREQVAGRWTQDYINVNDKGSLRNRRFTVRCKGGVEKHIHFRGSILGNGKHLMTYEDVTELVKAEEALRESERMYREFVEFLPQSMFEFNLDGIFTFANKHALETFGFSKDDLADGVSVFDLMPPHERSRAAETIEKILQRDHRGAMEYTAVRKDGTAFPVMVYSAPLVTDGRLRGIRGIIVDITELKQAEHALRESETRFRTLIESARDSIFIKDRTLRYALVNPALARLLKGTVSELTGKSDEDFFDDEMVSVIRDEDMKVLSGETIEEEHVMFMRGDARTFHVIKTPMRDNEGHIIGLCGIARDVTELRKMENHFRDAQKMEAIGTLAGGIAHDFNNILMAIQGYTSLLLLNLGADHPHYEKLKKIETNVESGADLTRQLLGFAQSGRYEIKPMELNAVLEKTAHMFTRTRKEITIHRSYQDSLWIVDADRGQMEQVFLNLFINAGQAMPGGGSIHIETRNETLRHDDVAQYGLTPGRYVNISIRDTGVGMDEKTQKRVFEPFFTTKEMKRGAGLGLAAVYGIVKGHGGVITVESETNRGTTFRIYLPVSAKQIELRNVQKGLDFGGHKTILLVDDEGVILDIAAEIIAAIGYEVVIAQSGNDAIRIFGTRRSEIDLVILDMIMPGMSGGETFDALRRINPGVKVILSSGYSIDGKAREIMNRGCNAFLQKPYQIDDLRRTINDILNDSEM